MRRVRAWLRAFGPLRLLDECAASMLAETGDEAEADLRRALAARPPLIQRLALRVALRAVLRQQAEAARAELSSKRQAPTAEETPPEELRRSA